MNATFLSLIVSDGGKFIGAISLLFFVLPILLNIETTETLWALTLRASDIKPYIRLSDCLYHAFNPVSLFFEVFCAYFLTIFLAVFSELHIVLCHRCRISLTELEEIIDEDRRNFSWMICDLWLVGKLNRYIFDMFYVDLTTSKNPFGILYTSIIKGHDDSISLGNLVFFQDLPLGIIQIYCYCFISSSSVNLLAVLITIVNTVITFYISLCYYIDHHTKYSLKVKEDHKEGVETIASTIGYITST